MKKLKFIKMHGLGNDFIIIDKRKQNIDINENLINKLSNRRTGAGCDQIITINKSSIGSVDAKIKIYNANGDQAEACGNGTRCVAKLLFDSFNKKNIVLESVAGILNSSLRSNGDISVNMGRVKENWSEIPLIKKMDTRNIPINIKNFTKGFAVNVGNPHIVFFGNNIDSLDLKNIGPKIEKHNFFPDKTNVEFIEINKINKVRMRVWERSVGETLACGSGACAAVFAGYKKNLLNNKCEVSLKNGSLFIEIIKGEVILTGPAKTTYYGDIVL